MSRDLQIVVAESSAFAPPAAVHLASLGEVTWGDFDRQGLVASLRDADVLWVRLRHQIDEEVMHAAPRLRWIATPTTGLNHIDLDAAARRGIGVLSLRGQVEFLSNVRATAELTMALMLALLRRLPEAIAHTRAGEWNRDLFRGSELYRRTVGIVGYGRLGRIVGRYLQAFGARVLGTDRRPVEVDPGIEMVDMAELLEQSDVVSLHVDLVPENVGFFNASCFRRMKQGSFLVNTARGELICEQALLAALRSGRLAGAALDVRTEEWAKDKGAHPLVRYARKHAHLLLTPHIGGLTGESLSQAETFLATLLARAVGAGESARPALVAVAGGE
jgi:D-3-phosphoglycerate dehydrogenase